jgi:hypothetical protein
MISFFIIQNHVFVFVGVVAGNDSQRGFGFTEVNRLMGDTGWDLDKIAFLIDS